MTTLTFPGQVPFADESVPAGGCEMGLGRCVHPAEVEVELPATNATRRLCREHVGWYMLAASSSKRRSVVRVRILENGPNSGIFGTPPTR